MSIQIKSISSFYGLDT